jgi:hypothetical protein
MRWLLVGVGETSLSLGHGPERDRGNMRLIGPGRTVKLPFAFACNFFSLRYLYFLATVL